jgi:hypothetical protein
VDTSDNRKEGLTFSTGVETIIQKKKKNAEK